MKNKTEPAAAIMIIFLHLFLQFPQKSFRTLYSNFCIRGEENRVAHFLVFEFPARKQEKWLIFCQINPGKPNKKSLTVGQFGFDQITYTWAWKCWHPYTPIKKRTTLLCFCSRLNNAQGGGCQHFQEILPKLSTMVYKVRISWYWLILVKTRKFLKKEPFPARNFLVSNFLVPIFLPGNLPF